jgi:hypothetical protein
VEDVDAERHARRRQPSLLNKQARHPRAKPNGEDREVGGQVGEAIAITTVDEQRKPQAGAEAR